MDERVLRWYRKLRRFPGTRASYCLNFARNIVAVEDAVDDGRIRFTWEYDTDYQPDGDYDLELERRRLESGEWEALGCIAEVPRACPHCGNTLEGEWDHAASLWGIVVEAGGEDSYQREVEVDLADEAGIFDTQAQSPA